MPGFDGTGPRGAGPMSGRVMGFCVLKESQGSPGYAEGFAGMPAKPVNFSNNMRFRGRQVTNMPRGDRTGPAGFGPMTGRAAGFCAGYPLPGYMNPTGAGAQAGVYGYGRGGYGYGRSYAVARPRYPGGFPGRGFGRGFGGGRRFRGPGSGFGRW